MESPCVYGIKPPDFLNMELFTRYSKNELVCYIILLVEKDIVINVYDCLMGLEVSVSDS